MSDNANPAGAGTEFRFKCSCCDEMHIGLPALGQKFPPAFLDVPEAFRDQYTRKSDDLCRIEAYPGSGITSAYYFIRGTFDIPIQGFDDTLSLGLWYSQSKESFAEYLENFDEDQSDRVSFGWAQPDSAEFKEVDHEGYLVATPCDVYWNIAGQRPYGIAHENAETKIARYQRDGICPREVEALMTTILHPDQQ